METQPLGSPSYWLLSHRWGQPGPRGPRSSLPEVASTRVFIHSLPAYLSSTGRPPCVGSLVQDGLGEAPRDLGALTQQGVDHGGGGKS